MSLQQQVQTPKQGVPLCNMNPYQVDDNQPRHIEKEISRWIEAAEISLSCVVLHDVCF